MPNGIEYFTIPELPDKPMFRCEKLHGSMQIATCGERWKIANDMQNVDGKFGACQNCTIGARHAGVGEISASPLRGMSICARCHQGTTRLVFKHLCVSCYNREREYRIGKNARGAVPVRHPELHELEVKYLDGDVPSKLRREAVQPVELVVAVLRDTSKPVVFGFNTKRPELPQKDLFS